MLIAVPGDLYLLRLKGHPGRVVNHGDTWQFHGDRVRTIRSPLYLTDLKAKELKGQLERAARASGVDPRQVPFIKPAVFLHDPGLVSGLGVPGGEEVGAEVAPAEHAGALPFVRLPEAVDLGAEEVAQQVALLAGEGVEEAVGRGGEDVQDVLGGRAVGFGLARATTCSRCCSGRSGTRRTARSAPGLGDRAVAVTARPR